MPLIKSSYKAPFLFKNKHVHTIYPSYCRKVLPINYKRERIDTPDQDFIEIDWVKNKSRSLAILLPGLEADSYTTYMVAMTHAFIKRGWDVVLYNPRGCSGVPNNKVYSYHAGKTDDLHLAINYINENYQYDKIALVGFSFGGNTALLYLGQNKFEIPGNLCRGAFISVPCDLVESSKLLNRQGIYLKYFLKKFHRTLLAKEEKMPDQISSDGFEKIKTIEDYTSRYVSKYFGYKDAFDYWEKTSCNQVLTDIKIRSLLINALDDPLLGENCYPIEQAKSSNTFYLETPKNGGHNGFALFNSDHEYWSEKRVTDFIINNIDH